MVQVEVPTVKLDRDPVAPPSDVLRVERLVHVADEVDDEFGGHGAFRVREGDVEQAGGVVGERGDDAAGGFFFAVAFEVDAAVCGG